MSEIIFRVQGSASDPYEVTFDKSDNTLTARCTCPAGEVGQYCKHRLRILRGDSTGIVSPNQKDVGVVKSWLSGTELESALNEFDSAEKEQEKAKKRLDLAKKKLARVMTN